MPFIGNKPSAVPLTSADIADGIITSAKIVDGTILNADINASSAIAISKIASTGTSLQVLRMNSGATALEFATPASGSYTFLGETTASNVATVDLNGYFTSDYDYYEIYLDGVYGSVNTQVLYIRASTTGSYTVDTSSLYGFAAVYVTSGGAVSNEAGNGQSLIRLHQQLSSTSAFGGAFKITLYNPNSTSAYKIFTANQFTGSGDVADFASGSGGAVYKNTAAVTGLRFFMSSGNLYARKIKIYGVKNT